MNKILIFFCLSIILVGCQKQTLEDETILSSEFHVQNDDGPDIIVTSLESTDKHNDRRRPSNCCFAWSDQQFSQARTDFFGNLRVVVRDVKFPSGLAMLRTTWFKKNDQSGKYEYIHTFRGRHPDHGLKCVPYSTGHSIGNWGFNNPVLPGNYKVKVAIVTGAYVGGIGLPGQGSNTFVEQVCYYADDIYLDFSE